MKQLLSGNEAIALGAYHAGLGVAAAYPGTPSTEILEAIACLRGVYAEWSPNEKVALDVAIGASWSGVRAMASMKHVGLNVAADPFFSVAYSGVGGGLVVITADDPGMHSSQNEQDNRHYARSAKVPLLEPADSQECYDFTRLAFELSERFNTPVLVRTTTRVAHSRTVVDVTGERPPLPEAKFRHDPGRFVLVPANARRLHPGVEARQQALAEYACSFPGNRVEAGDGRLGIVTSGVAYHYAREVFPEASLLKLGLSYPTPETLLRSFAASVRRLVVVEELDPIMEGEIKALGLAAEGKSIFPILGEFDLGVVEASARRAGLLAGDSAEALPAVPDVPLPPRPPVLCPGCPHRSTFYVLSLLGRRQKRADGSSQEPQLVIAGDIGCYTLGVLPPLGALDSCVSMGSSIGMALGAAKAGVKDKIVAVIGDSTFMHSGIAALVDVVYNQGNLTVVVLDNGTTAMTGHQENPATGVSALGQQTQAIDIANLARAVGVSDVREANAFDLPGLRRALKGAFDNPGASVVVVKGLCALRNKEPKRQAVVDAEKCNACGLCLRISCPAVVKGENGVTIDQNLCVGSVCQTLCGQVCAHDAIHLAEL
ncbi:MAG: indolepyruvate ferredoxin oxidoreductase subunit alpha [Chloroflexi bacterium]|nr:indolepyruvate ferredoxin oxidoreductase subunit alpha [Chloroflexota bacterium]